MDRDVALLLKAKSGDLQHLLWQEIQPVETRWSFQSLMRVPAFAALILVLSAGAWFLWGPGPASGPIPVYAAGRIQCSVKGIKDLCCVGPIQSALRKIEGMVEVKVNAGNSEVGLITEKGKAVKVAKIAKSLRQCGDFSLTKAAVYLDNQGP